MFDLTGQTVDQTIRERLDSLVVRLHLLLSDPTGFTQTNDQWGRNRSTPQTSLLSTTMNQRLKSDSRPSPDVGSSDTLGSVDLVCGY